MMRAADLIALFQRMYRERWSYAPGAARTGCADCSGAFVWAYRQLGGTIAHGSNAIARRHVAALLPVREAEPGMAAFKRRDPADPRYALPAKYRAGGASCTGDPVDWYHIGLVDADGKHVLSAQGTKAGFTRTEIGGWDAVGRLKEAAYPGKAEDGAGETAMEVTSPDSGPVRVRKSPSASAAVRDSLPAGARVTAREVRGDWARIRYEAEGWMMRRYLKGVE